LPQHHHVMLKEPKGSILLADNILVSIGGLKTPSNKLFWLAYALFMLSPPETFRAYQFLGFKPLSSGKLAQLIPFGTYSY